MKDFRGKNMKYNFQEILLLFLTIVILGIVVYVSATSPSKEEFTELYWKIFKVDFLQKAQVVCALKPCSISGFYDFGNITLDNKNYRIVLVDLDTAWQYSAMCIDINQNNVFCEKGEGPFRERDSFLIGSDSFTIISSNEKNFAIANYPRRVNVNNFTVGYVVKSYYRKTQDFNVSLFVNETLKESKILTISPQQEIVSQFNVFLPSKGLFRVKIDVTPSTTSQKSYIDFWVNASSINTGINSRINPI
jgi:hypothetical protein